METNGTNRFRAFHHPSVFLVLLLTLPLMLALAYYLKFNYEKTISMPVSILMLVVITMVLYVARYKLQTEIIIKEDSIEFQMLTFWPSVRSQLRSYTWSQVQSVSLRPRWSILVLNTTAQKYTFLCGGLLAENDRLYVLIKQHVSTGLTTGSTATGNSP